MELTWALFWSSSRSISMIGGRASCFAHPDSSRGRGLNENTNGRLRPYFTKGPDFNQITGSQIAKVEQKLNLRPPECLGRKTPAPISSLRTDGCASILNSSWMKSETGRRRSPQFVVVSKGAHNEISSCTLIGLQAFLRKMMILSMEKRRFETRGNLQKIRDGMNAVQTH